MTEHSPHTMSSSPLIMRGDVVAEAIRNNVRHRVDEYIQRFQRSPHLAVVLSFDHPASKIYVGRKTEACREVGIRSTTITTPCSSTEELIDIIETLNRDPDIDAILVQFPLHPDVDTFKVTEAIDPQKDVDGFNPRNLGKIIQGNVNGLLPCTPKGIIRLLEFYGFSPEGQHAVIVGRSMVVGKPLALLLSSSSSIGNATVSIAHRKTKDLAQICKKADILIAAAGSAGLIGPDMVKEGAVVIDVGINRVPDLSQPHDSNLPQKKKLVGDVSFSEVLPKVKAITPVPKGVGPMTVACLLENTLQCAFERALSTIAQ